MNYRIIWAFIILAVIIGETVHANPFLILPLETPANWFNRYVDIAKFTTIQSLYGDHIQGRPEVFLAYSISFGGPAVILWVCLGLLYYTLLKDRYG